MIRQLEVVHLGIQVHFVDQLHGLASTCGVKGNQVTFASEIEQGFSDFLINKVLVGDVLWSEAYDVGCRYDFDDFPKGAKQLKGRR